jgi:hypothetical protein
MSDRVKTDWGLAIYRAHLLGRSKSRAEQGRRVFFGHRDNAIANHVPPGGEPVRMT